MSPHPVAFYVAPPTAHDRFHLAIRLVLLLVLGAFGCSSLYWTLYLALPALVALFVVQKGGEAYLAESAPRVVGALRWVAAAYAYLWLLTDVPPNATEHPVRLEIELGAPPTPGSALLRLLGSLPALVLLILLSMLGSVLWLVAALFVLIQRRVPAPLGEYLSATLRYQFRLLAYHLSLVDRYPSLDGSTLAGSSASTPA